MQFKRVGVHVTVRWGLARRAARSDNGSMTDQEIIDALRAEVAELKQIVKQQAALITQLQAAQSSKSSHAPPSSDSPKARSERKKRTRKKSLKSQGGQPGHHGSHRQMLAPDQVDFLLECVPQHCSDCGASLSGESLQMRRHQVWEIPPITPVVTECQLHKLACSCGCSTWASLPHDVLGESQFGPRVHAVVSTMRTQARTSLALTQTLCK